MYRNSDMARVMSMARAVYRNSDMAKVMSSAGYGWARIRWEEDQG